jgi:hypothetical protein
MSTDITTPRPSEQPAPIQIRDGVYASPASIAARATELLDALGATRGEVAERLLEDGHRGVPGSCTRCPVALFLLRSDLGLIDVMVGDIEVELRVSDYELPIRITTPASVTDFLLAFDHGTDYQDLNSAARRRWLA